MLDTDDWVGGGFLLKWVFGSHEGEGPAKGTTGGSWRDWASARFGAARGVPRGGGGRGGVSVSADDDGVGGMLARGPRGGRYNDEQADVETGRGRSRGMHGAGTAEEGRVLVGGDSDEEDNENDATTVWQQGGALENEEEGIVLGGSDDDDEDDENRMTSNEIRDRRGD